MGIIDIIIIAVLVIGFISGLQKGFITSLLACAALFGAFLIAGALEGKLFTAFMGTNVQKWLDRNLEVTPNLYHVLSYVVVFILAYCALMLIVNLINNVFRVPKLRGVDALLGGVLGIVRAYVIICVGVAVINTLSVPLQGEGVQLNLLDESALGRFFASGKGLADIFGITKLIKGL